MDRHRQRYASVLEVGLDEASADTASLELNDLEFDRADDLEQLDDTLQPMSFVEREVLVLFYLQELSLAEITEVLALPVGTVTWARRQAHTRGTTGRALPSRCDAVARRARQPGQSRACARGSRVEQVLYVAESLDTVREIEAMVASMSALTAGDYTPLAQWALRDRAPRPLNLMNLAVDCASSASRVCAAGYRCDARLFPTLNPKSPLITCPSLAMVRQDTV